MTIKQTLRKYIDQVVMSSDFCYSFSVCVSCQDPAFEGTHLNRDG